MHDIGKALTHELDGSHAVIGADYARRLGEAELVANAIGAHHTDEPFASPYAYLVAAADAMSGARPGARRQTEDNHMAKIADLERISRGFAGVAEAFAVQGGPRGAGGGEGGGGRRRWGGRAVSQHRPRHHRAADLPRADPGDRHPGAEGGVPRRRRSPADRLRNFV